jgi:hypothetical protein
MLAANPNGYALIDDTPVSGYVARLPPSAPAARVSFRPVPLGSKGLIIAIGEVPGRMPFR